MITLAPLFNIKRHHFVTVAQFARLASDGMHRRAGQFVFTAGKIDEASIPCLDATY